MYLEDAFCCIIILAKVLFFNNPTDIIDCMVEQIKFHTQYAGK